MPLYQERYPVGSRVQIKSREFLEEFRREWKYHHPLSPEQVEAAGQLDRVEGAGFYHGGDVLYQLKKHPGTWHEICLEDAPKDKTGFWRRLFVVRTTCNF
jgi:hypothetical protein